MGQQGEAGGPGAVHRDASVTVGGVRSPVLAAGPASSREAVVYVHGNPGSAGDWPDLAGEVGAFARFVALDMPGFGRADKPDAFDYTVEGYARHLAGALAALKVERAHLVLHDFGGPWGLAWAAAHPDAFASVTLLGTGVLFDYRWHRLARLWRTPGLGELFMLAARARPFWRALATDLPATYLDQMFAHFDAGTRRAILRLYRASGDVPAFARRQAALLAPLRRPALVVWGKRDPYLPWSLAERQREVFSDAQVSILDGGGHWPFIDQPQTVRDLVVPFLRLQVGRDARGLPSRAFPHPGGV